MTLYRTSVGVTSFLVFLTISLLFGSWILIHFIALVLLLMSVLPLLSFNRLGVVGIVVCTLALSLLVTIGVWLINPELDLFNYVPSIIGQK